jgi:hypothetical protein
MELNAFMKYPNEGIACLVNPLGHEQYRSKSLNKIIALIIHLICNTPMKNTF